MIAKFDFNKIIGLQLYSTSLILKSIVSNRFEQHNSPISFDDWLNLLPIARSNGISQKQLAEILNKDKTTISRFVDSMIAKGFVRKKVSTGDRRAVELYLTANGIKFFNDSIQIIEDCNNDSLKKLTTSEVKNLMQILSKLGSHKFNQPTDL